MCRRAPEKLVVFQQNRSLCLHIQRGQAITPQSEVLTAGGWIPQKTLGRRVTAGIGQDSASFVRTRFLHRERGRITLGLLDFTGPFQDSGEVGEATPERTGALISRSL